MKRKLLFALGALAAFVVVVLIIASFQPKEYRVERVVTSSASAQSIFAIMSDFNQFSRWSPWQKLDPNMKNEIQGAPATVGSSLAWDGNDDVGAGKMTFSAVQPPQQVDVDLEFIRPFPGKNHVIWRVDDNVTERKIMWAMEGSNDSIFARAMCLFMNMDKMVGKDFEAGLNNLKAAAEHSTP